MGPKKICQSKKFLVENFFESTIFWVIKILGQKIFWVKKNVGKKIFGQKGMVYPRWSIYDPPPLENSRVKIVLDCC